MSFTPQQQGDSLLHIKQLFWNAPKEFKNLGWKEGEAGVGIALAKIEARADKHIIPIRICKDERIYKVSPPLLANRIKLRGCYNQNGSFRVGYVTKSDIYDLARQSKEGVTIN